MSDKKYRFESRGFVIEGTKEQVLALYELIHYEDSVVSYLTDVFSDIEVTFPEETNII
jgi:hypothetical protein